MTDRDRDVKLVADAIGTVLSEDDYPVHPATLERATRAALDALASDDSGVEVQLRARWMEVRGWKGSQARTEQLDELNKLARRLEIDLRPMPDSMG